MSKCQQLTLQVFIGRNQAMCDRVYTNLPNLTPEGTQKNNFLHENIHAESKFSLATLNLTTSFMDMHLQLYEGRLGVHAWLQHSTRTPSSFAHILFYCNGKCTRAASRLQVARVNTRAVKWHACEPTHSKCSSLLREQCSVVCA